ncbi:DUF3347 domain-containing protein [Pedobacter nyackensis]|uniref:DUF3347 domain-containing protein n=1 Tax=Pedobacter nyackensis TaxID=475255 RepID=UPI00292EF77B|nr:DUF3347 domain-containing protein [Pedobacter nyackensis]
MKTLIYSLSFSVLLLAACSENSQKDQSKVQMSSMDTSNTMAVNSKKRSSTTSLINSYLKLKNALATDNDKGAAAAGNEMVIGFTNFDSKSLNSEQGKVYMDVQEAAKEHAEHISSNIGNLAHQREHFDMLSVDMYDLIKALGTSLPLYVDHCPMYNNNKGAIWLSEMKEIKNPYLGKAMPNCGNVKEKVE